MGLIHHQHGVVAGGDLGDEFGLGAADVLDRLPGHRLRQEADEIAGMPGRERHADLALLLHAADARPVAGARIDDDERRLCRVRVHAFRRADARQHVVHRARESAPVHHQVGAVVQHVRRLAGIVLVIGIPAFAQHVQEQRRTLADIEPILLHGAKTGLGRHVISRCYGFFEPTPVTTKPAPY